MPYEPALAAPASPYRSSPYEVVHPPMPGAYSQGIPGVSPVVTELGGNSRVQLTIVGAQVGAVLGRNGTNISQIRQVSLLAITPAAASRAARWHTYSCWLLTTYCSNVASSTSLGQRKYSMGLVGATTGVIDLCFTDNRSVTRLTPLG